MERKKSRQCVPQPRAVRPNAYWSANFVSDKLSDGRAVRSFTVVDLFMCEWICLKRSLRERDQSGCGSLTHAIAGRGAVPGSLNLDNGSEFTGRAMEASAMETGVQLCFILPGRPVENGLSRAQRASAR
jgi:putative transposase